MKNTSLCCIEREGKYLMFHRTKKVNDDNHGKWKLEWVEKERLLSLPIREGDKVFLRMIQSGAPFFSMKLCYQGERLVSAALNGKAMKL